MLEDLQAQQRCRQADLEACPRRKPTFGLPPLEFAVGLLCDTAEAIAAELQIRTPDAGLHLQERQLEGAAAVEFDRAHHVDLRVIRKTLVSPDDPPGLVAVRHGANKVPYVCADGVEYGACRPRRGAANEQQRMCRSLA